MVVINSGDRLPDLVIVTICRWLWRYRSELAPFTIAVLTALAAWMLHATHPHWWPALAAATVAAMLGAAFGGHAARPGHPHRALLRHGRHRERGRMAGHRDRDRPWPRASAPGPPDRHAAYLPCPGGRTAGAAPRSASSALLAAWPEIAPAVGLAGSRVMSAVVDVWGWRARFALARGQTITDVIARLPAIESGLGTFRGAARVYPTPDDLANRFELRVLDKDPHADAITWPGPSVASITEPIDLGPFEDATPAHGPAAAPARPVRRRDRIGQERRPQRAHGQPDRLRRRGDLGHRPQARHGTRPLGRVHRPPGHHARRGPRAAGRRGGHPRSPRRATSPPPASASGNPPRTCPPW